MSKINSRAKGAAGERELANVLKGYGFEARRGQQFCGSNDSPDVVSNFPFLLECKRVQNLNLVKAMEKIVEEAEDKPGCVCHRKNGTEWLFTCRLEDIIPFIKKYHESLGDCEDQ